MRTRSTFIALLIAGLCGCQTTGLDLPVDSEIQAGADRVVDPQEIVVITPSTSEARSLVRKAVPLGYSVQAEDTLGGLELIMLTLMIPEGQDGGTAIRELERLEPGVTAGVNHGYVPQAGAHRETGRLYAAELLGWRTPGCEAALKIGVLDTAIDQRFSGSVISADFSRSTDHSESNTHGNDTLDLLLAPGMLHDTKVLHADVVTPDDRLGAAASVDSLLRGLNWLIQSDVRLINISLAGPYNKILDRAFQRAAQEGVIIVAAAGNEGPESPASYPAGFASTLAVTAIDSQTQIYPQATRGDRIDFSAPGVDVRIPSQSAPRYSTGTSIAAPFVTMRIAGDPAIATELDIGKVRERLASTARDLGPQGHDPVYGFGLIDAPPGCQSN